MTRRIRRILSLDGSDVGWRSTLERLIAGDESLTRRSAGEGAIIAVQRMLVFLGYSTAASGALLIDGDFGRGTNRGVAQFKFEHRLGSGVRRAQLCYPCSFNTARKKIVAVPEVRLDVATLEAMLETAVAAIGEENVPLGRFEDALFHLNAVHRGSFLTCQQIEERYGRMADAAAARLHREQSVQIQPEWILSIIRQETAGVVRPRFEQHILSRLNAASPRENIAELRYRSMSIGLGQIMGFNFERVGAPSARSLITSPIEEQVLYVARFIAHPTPGRVVVKRTPGADDFRTLARYYNGPRYEAHEYHERLERWFNEFRLLRGD